MTLTNGKQPIRREEQAKFLERDFSECFAQLRHYDGQIWDICKFTFVSYTTVLAVAIGLYEYSLDKGVNLRPVAIAVLAASSLLGIFMLCLTVRNRLYFVLVTRYVNEHRGHFLEGKPLGFQNRAGMYTDPTKPQFYNWRSSQLWLTSIVAVLNAAVADCHGGDGVARVPVQMVCCGSYSDCESCRSTVWCGESI